MTSMILDSQTAERLRVAGQRIELRDTSGRILGYFSPAVDQDAYRSIKEPFTNEDLDRFENEPGGRSLEEIKCDLRGGS